MDWDEEPPQIASDGAGDTVILWTRDLRPSGKEHEIIEVVTKKAGSAWSQPVQLATAHGYTYPDVAIDARGEATVVWSETDGEGARRRSSVFARSDSPEGVWKAAAMLWARQAGDARVAVDGRGQPVVVLDGEASNGRSAVILLKRRNPRHWSPPRVLTTVPRSGGLGSLQIAIDGRGETLLAWTLGSETVKTLILGGNDRPEQPIATVDNLVGQELELVCNRDGAAQLTGTREETGGGPVEVASRLPGRGFAQAVDIVPASWRVFLGQSAIGPSGTAVMLFARNSAGDAGSGGVFTVQIASRAAHGHWSRPAPFPPAITTKGHWSAGPALAQDSHGTMMAIWTAYAQANEDEENSQALGIASSMRSVGQPWRPATMAVSADAYSPVLAAATDGFTAAWITGKRGAQVVETAELRM
jgi:hypothetical protein